MDHLMKNLLPVLLACAVSQVNGQQITSPVSSIRVTGEAVVTAKPERAQIDVGVLTQEKLSQNAATQNARQIDSVMVALHKVLGPDADIRTVNYSLSPDYQYRPIGGKPSVSSYTATNVVRVTLDDLDKVGWIIDTATQAGANHIESVRYTVRDPQVLHSQAVKEAALKARSSAEALAAALNLRIIRTLTVEEGVEAAGPADVSVPELRDAAAAAPTPIQSGSFVVTANVQLTVEVAAR
jgi:uncharacterized protein YggE